MSLYGRIFAAMYDTVMKGTEEATFGAHRAALLGGISGRVIEIGGGTGANLPHYGAGAPALVITAPPDPRARRPRAPRRGGADGAAARGQALGVRPSRARRARARGGAAGRGRELRLRGL